MPLDSNYNPKKYEKDIYESWIKHKVNSPEKQWQIQQKQNMLNLAETPKTYTILMPPPNLTGELHAGHAFQHYLMDTLARINRQKKHKTLWYPGIDHAGIQMEGVLGKLLKEQGKSRTDLTDIEFLDFAWQKANEWRNRQQEQASVLGDTPDYDRQLFTLDERATNMVNYAFEKYWKDGLIYKTSYLINWSTGLQTALSDVAGEIEYENRIDPLITFEYRLESVESLKNETAVLGQLREYFSQNPILVSTVRPETIFGDVAVAIHPEIFQKLLKTNNFSETEIQEAICKIQENDWIILFGIEPLGVHNIRLIIAEEVDPNFGTGALKITPASDMHDYEIFEKYLGGEFPKPIGRDGCLTEICGKFAGLNVEDGRLAILETLLESGFIPKKLM